MPTSDLLVIGAGVSGLACANALSARGASVRVLEKSRGVGGRCATRRVDGQPVDHGSAFYHGDDLQLRELFESVDAARLDGWPRVVVGEGSPCQPRAFRAGEWRLAFREGMTAFPKHLARGLRVDLAGHVREVRRLSGGGLLARTEDGRDYAAAAVCLCTPAPQALELLPRPGDGPPELETVRHLLGGVSYVRCLTLLAGFEPKVLAPDWHMAYPEDSRILQLVSHDSSKRERPGRTVLVLQALPHWSRESWERPAESWSLEMLREAASRYGDWIRRPRWMQTRRWRFARVGGGGDMCVPPIVDLPDGSRLGVSGEAFAWGRGVQAAWRSGIRLAERMAGDC
jgi:predicted NAD/FAD-dependent oxidoreductase